MGGGNESRERQIYTVRLSFRSHSANMDKLLTIAKAKGWLNSKGRPNISAVLNYVIEHFDTSSLKRKRKENTRGRRRAQGSP